MKKTLLSCMLSAIVLVIAACGSNTSESASTGGVVETGTAASEQVEIKAKSWEFDQPEYKIKKGVPTKLTVTNESGFHGIEIPDLGIKVQGGESEVVTINDAGTYEFHCDIACGAGHATMKGKLVVE